jgi:hypothetical protein
MFPSTMDLVEILKRPEGKTLEFKRDLSFPDGALKTIVASPIRPEARCSSAWRTAPATFAA